jgi:hypothetical protein
MGGGGGKQPTEQTVTQNSIPKELMPYATQLMGRAQALTDINQNPFQAYSGQRVADINPLMQQGLAGAADLGPSEQMFQGGNLALAGGLGSLNTGRFGVNEASEYMSPYLRNVLDVQKNEAMRDYARQSPQMAAGAARYGGLGGSRGAIAQSEAMRNLNNNLQNIDATGLQKGFENAQSQYNTEQQRRLVGLQQAIGAGSNLGQIGQNIYGQRAGALQAQQTAGSTLRDIEQNRLNAQYEQFGEEKRYPYEQLGFMSDLLRGVPTYQSAQTSYKAPPSMLSQIGGLATGLGGLYMAGKKGGD